VRFLFWLIAITVLVAVVIPALVSLTLIGFWLARWMVPWLAIGLGIWMLSRMTHEPRRHRWSNRDWYSERDWKKAARANPNPRPTTLPTTPPKSAEPAQPPALPIDVEVKVQQIQKKVEVLLGYASRFPVFSQDLYLVRQTASEYLPRTLNAYQALNVAGAGQVEMAAGKTAQQELMDQLSLLDGKLDEIAQDLQRRDLDHLLANRQFLEERFGHRSA